MQNKNNESKKIVIGVVVGGIIGGSALYLWHSLHNENKPILNKIGKAITGMGEILENSAVCDSDDAIDQIGKSLPKGDNTLNNVLTWVATGINLWNKVKKGS
jgi:hypothetical protein